MLSPGETNTVSRLRQAASLLSLPGSLADPANNLGLPNFLHNGGNRQDAEPDLESGQEDGDTPEVLRPLPQPPEIQPPALVRPERERVSARPVSILAPHLTLPGGWGLRVWNAAPTGRPLKVICVCALY